MPVPQIPQNRYQRTAPFDTPLHLTFPATVSIVQIFQALSLIRLSPHGPAIQLQQLSRLLKTPRLPISEAAITLKQLVCGQPEFLHRAGRGQQLR